MSKCKSKRAYYSRELAVEALINVNVNFENTTVISIYECEDCGEWHLTSKPPMVEELKAAIQNGDINKAREAKNWEKRFR